METSDYYMVVERMIRHAEVATADLANLLSTLEEQGRITGEERQALLDLAARLNQDDPAPR